MQELYPEYSRQQIQSWIMQGKVKVDGRVVTKAGTPVSIELPVECDAQEPKYVSRAGFKLEKALDEFGIDVTGFTVLDAGLSTGGFTDCLIKKGAKKIFGVDVGYGQVHEKIRSNEHVVVMERTNLRSLEWAQEPVDLVTLDLSFISVLKVMVAVTGALKKDGHLIVLIKPQFEAERHEVGRGGIIKDQAVHQKVVEKITGGIKGYGYQLIGVTESPILGGSGNKEFLAYFKRANA